MQGLSSLRTSPLLKVRRRSATLGGSVFFLEMWGGRRFFGFFGVCGLRFFQKLAAWLRINCIFAENMENK